MSPGFSNFSVFLQNFVLAKLATSIIRVKHRDVGCVLITISPSKVFQEMIFSRNVTEIK